MMRMSLAIAILLCSFATQTYAQQSTDAFSLYQRVTSGVVDFNSLTPQQKQQVLTIHSVVSRPSCGNYKGRCAEACEARIRLADAASDLAKCAKRTDLSDDCSRKFRYTKAAFSDYESAVSDISGDCD